VEMKKPRLLTELLTVSNYSQRLTLGQQSPREVFASACRSTTTEVSMILRTKV
jgi:hypothetical protein